LKGIVSKRKGSPYRSQSLARFAEDEGPGCTSGEARGRRRLEWKEVAMIGKNRIMIYGPKEDETYVVEFRTSEGDALAISIPRGEADVIRHFQERMPYGLCVWDDRSAVPWPLR
jgi:hypothetical protein